MPLCGIIRNIFAIEKNQHKLSLSRCPTSKFVRLVRQEGRNFHHFHFHNIHSASIYVPHTHTLEEFSPYSFPPFPYLTISISVKTIISTIYICHTSSINIWQILFDHQINFHHIPIHDNNKRHYNQLSTMSTSTLSRSTITIYRCTLFRSLIIFFPPHTPSPCQPNL